MAAATGKAGAAASTAQRQDENQRQGQAEKQQRSAGGIGFRRPEMQRWGGRRVLLLRLLGTFEGVVDQAHRRQGVEGGGLRIESLRRAVPARQG